MRKNIGLYRGEPIYLGAIRDARPDVLTEDNFVYGSLIVYNNKYFICTAAYCTNDTYLENGRATLFQVIPESIEECTSLTDKNNKPIFEGDIVKVKWGEKWSCRYEFFTVFIDNMSCYLKPKKITKDVWVVHMDCYKSSQIEVVGNIHSNPELLKGGMDK